MAAPAEAVKTRLQAARGAPLKLFLMKLPWASIRIFSWCVHAVCPNIT
jgi:hypothetical protein